VTVSQRADCWAQIGSPKSQTSRRTIPLGEPTARALRAWKLAQPPVVTKDAEGNEITRPRTLVSGPNFLRSNRTMPILVRMLKAR
jgi:hypothetical protein